MTMLDVFAAAALAGIMANPDRDHWPNSYAAEWAYNVAQWMLVERAKKG